MVLRFEGKDFANLKYIAERILKDISKARNYKELPVAGAGGYGNYANDFAYSVEYTCPDEQRIANLRAEADQLEAKLKSA